MEKGKEELVILQSFGESLITKVVEMFPPSDWMDYAMEKGKEILVILQSSGESLVSKANEIFPPETRVEQIQHCLHLGKPYIIPG
ncbi:hypothetical protein KUO10_23535, partial [Vibrio vulnificus]|uniref:hypothetical protein n=1 Tax=Vibrio vulnificus TaxID=672 RepID=UPI001CD00797